MYRYKKKRAKKGREVVTSLHSFARNALLCGLFGMIGWKMVGNPLSIDGSIVGVLCNLAAFALSTRSLRRHQRTSLTIWK